MLIIDEWELQMTPNKRWFITFVSAAVLWLIGVFIARDQLGRIAGIADSVDSGFERNQILLKELSEKGSGAIYMISRGSSSSKSMWEIYLRQARKTANNRGYIKFTSQGYITTDKGEELLPIDFRERITEQVRARKGSSHGDIVEFVLDKEDLYVENLCDEIEVSLEAIIGIISGYVRKTEMEI